MPATPAWPPKSAPRLYVSAALAAGVVVNLEQSHANYLGRVLRLVPGNNVLLFNGTDGEWLATISEARKQRITLTVQRTTRPQECVPDLWLAFAPVKRAQTDWLVEKVTELGVAHLLPVITARTIVERVKLERLKSIAIEAAEQCNRTTVPEVAHPVSLAGLLSTQGAARRLYFADEAGGEILSAAMRPGPAIILTGPEGGFTDDERNKIRSVAGAIPISLGPRILRAETAALAAVTAWMTLAGDWNAPAV